MKKKDSNKKEQTHSSSASLFAKIIITVIIVTFVFTGTSLLGINKIFKMIGKEKIKNEDGTISIPADAQVTQNKEEQDTYIGKVLGERIRLDPGRAPAELDEFNRNFVRIYTSKYMEPIQKYQGVRYYFNQTINKIISMYNARKMNMTITKDYLIQEVGERYFIDNDGDIDFYAMKKNSNKVTQLIQNVRDDLILENFSKDYFLGLPVSYEEVWDNYKTENTKVSLKYIDISNKKVDKKKIEQYYDNNKKEFEQYKLTRLVFKNMDDAEATLNTLQEDPSKFVETGNKLKEEGKIINIIYDAEYTFIDDFESPSLKEAVKNTQTGKIGDVVASTNLGAIIFLVNNKKYGDFYDVKVYERLKTDYLEKNYLKIDEENKKSAEKVYKYSKKNGLDKAVKKFNLKIESSSPTIFMGHNIPNLNPDTTNGLNFMVSIFKSNEGDILEPYKYDNGYMVAMVSDMNRASKENFDDLYDDLSERSSTAKSRNIEIDYYNSERKKYEIVDNFQYVFNYQMFITKKDSQ